MLSVPVPRRAAGVFPHTLLVKHFSKEGCQNPLMQVLELVPVLVRRQGEKEGPAPHLHVCCGWEPGFSKRGLKNESLLGTLKLESLGAISCHKPKHKYCSVFYNRKCGEDHSPRLASVWVSILLLLFTQRCDALQYSSLSPKWGQLTATPELFEILA